MVGINPLRSDLCTITDIVFFGSGGHRQGREILLEKKKDRREKREKCKFVTVVILCGHYFFE